MITPSKYILVLVCFFSAYALAQPNTEVYLMDLTYSEESLSLSNFRNISNDSGYDNQPSFLNDDVVIFAANNNGQTDIAQYDIKLGKKSWNHKGSSSSQYSPQIVPNSKDVLSVHLDTVGRQRLFIHESSSGNIREAHPEIQVAYFAMYNEDILLGAVLGGNTLNMVVANLKTQQVDTLNYNAGRSFHRIPDTKNMSYTFVNEDGNHDIYLLDMSSFESFFITQLPIGVQDHIWLDETTLLTASGARLYKYDLYGEGAWQEAANLSEYNIDSISRMAINSDASKLIFVALSEED